MRAPGAAEAAAKRSVPVWDPLVRIVHWSLAFVVLLNGLLLDEESRAHVWAGYAALGLVGLRAIWGVIGPEHARFSAFPPSLGAARAHLSEQLAGGRRRYLSHNPLGALMAYNLWLTLLAIAATGMMMESEAFFGVAWVEEAHEALFNWLVVSVALHVGGALYESRHEGQSLVRAMIDGRKRPSAPDRRA